MYLAKDSSISRFDIDGVARVEAVALSPDQKWIAAGADDGGLHVWWRPDPNKPARKLTVRAKENSNPISALDISRDNRLLASAAGNEVDFYELPAGDPGGGIAPVGEPLHYASRILSVALSPNDETVLTSAEDSTAQLWSRNQPTEPLRVLRGHLRTVWQARFAPDGQQIVTASDDESVRLWDVQGNELRRLEGHQGPVYTAEFSPDGNYVVSGGRDRRLLAWDLQSQGASQSRTQSIRQRLEGADEIGQNRNFRQLGEHAAAIRCVSFSPDGKVLYSASDDNSLRVWNIGQGVTDGQLVKSLRGHGGWVRSCSPAADGEHVLSGSYDGQVYLWDWTKYAFPRVLRPESERTLSEIRFTAAASSPDARWIATAAEDGTVTMWDMADPLNPASQLLREGHDWQATTGVYFPGGSRLLTAAGDNSALVWDARRGNQILRIGGWNTTGGTGWRGVADVAHHGRSIATGSDEPGILAKIWDAKSGRLIAALKSPQLAQRNQGELPEATAVAFAPDDESLFVGDQWGHCYLFRTEDGTLIHSFVGHKAKINAAAFLPNGRLLTASSDATVAKWNLQTKQANPQPELTFVHGDRVVALDVSRDGKSFITASDPNDEDAVLRVWNADSAENYLHHLPFNALTELVEGNGAANRKPTVRSVALHPQQPHALVTVFDPRTSAYRLGKWEWNNASSTVEWISTRLRDTSMAVYSPSREGTVLTVGGRGARLRLANQVVMSYRPQSRVQSVAFSPDSRLLASAGDDGSIKLWRFEGERWLPEQKLLGGHQGPVNSVAFHPLLGDVLLTAGDDGATKLWQRAADGWKAATIGGENARQGPVRQAIFSPPGGDQSVNVVTAADDGVKIWTLDGQLLGTLPHDRPVQCVAVSPDGKWFATGAGSEAWVWNPASQQAEPVQKLAGHSAEITSIAFSPDGQRLFTASRDFTVKLWDTARWSADGGAAPTSRELLTLEQHRDSVVAVSFFASPTYPSLLTAGADGQAILWPSVGWSD